MKAFSTLSAFNAVMLFGVTEFILCGAAANAETSTLASLANGSLQSKYEERFKAANPFKSTAIAAVGALKYGVFGQGSDGVVVGTESWLFTTEELETQTDFEKNIQAAAHQISFVVGELKQNSVRVLPVLVPDKAEIYSDKLGFDRSDKVKNRRALLNAELAQNGTAFLDATRVLQENKQYRDVFLRDDTHWSPLGSNAVAQEIAKTLNNVDLQRSEVTTTVVNNRLFDGDLLSYVPTGSFRAWIGPAQTTIDTFETTLVSQGGLFGDVAVEVVLIGTSFSAKKEWHFEGFLKQALQADILNFAQEGQGPFPPMEAFLASETYQNTPPKVVIWEIPVRYTSKEMMK